jgi:hypothetical protein
MIFHDVPQNTEQWEALRLGKATHSHAPTWMANEGKAFGEPARAYALQVALELETGRKSENAGFSSFHTDRGHAQEPVAKMLYERETFSKVKNGGFFCWGTYGDSPDGLPGDGVLEIKSVIAKVHLDTLRRQSFDPAYKWQLVGHLDCTGRDWCDFASYCADFPEDKQLLIFRLDRAAYAEDIKRLRDRRAAFLDLIQQTRREIRGETYAYATPTKASKKAPRDLIEEPGADHFPPAPPPEQADPDDAPWVTAKPVAIAEANF